MILTGGNGRPVRENCPSATLSTTKLKCADLASNLGMHSERPANDLLLRDTVCKVENNLHHN